MPDRSDHILHLWAVTYDPDFEPRFTVECNHPPTQHRVWWECEVKDPHDEDELDHTGMAHGVEHQRFNGVWMTEGTQCYPQVSGDPYKSLWDDIEGFRLTPGHYDLEYDAGDWGAIWMLAYPGFPQSPQIPQIPPEHGRSLARPRRFWLV